MGKITGTLATREVFINDKRLSPDKSLAVYNHSPDGFNWGYGGSGPAQLALAILLEATDEQTALYWHQSLKWDIIAALPQDDFEIEFDFDKWLEAN